MAKTGKKSKLLRNKSLHKRIIAILLKKYHIYCNDSEDLKELFKEDFIVVKENIKLFKNITIYNSGSNIIIYIKDKRYKGVSFSLMVYKLSNSFYKNQIPKKKRKCGSKWEKKYVKT